MKLFRVVPVAVAAGLGSTAPAANQPHDSPERGDGAQPGRTGEYCHNVLDGIHVIEAQDGVGRPEATTTYWSGTLEPDEVYEIPEGVRYILAPPASVGRSGAGCVLTVNDEVVADGEARTSTSVRTLTLEPGDRIRLRCDRSGCARLRAGSTAVGL